MALAHHNVFVGISLANKLIDHSQVINILHVARRELGAKKIAFLIADEIDLINERVFGKSSEKESRLRVFEKAQAVQTLIEECCPKGALRNGSIVVVRWLDVLTSSYWKRLAEIWKSFIEEPRFREDVVAVARLYADRRSACLTQAEILFLCQYILLEIPTFLDGVHIRGKQYLTMLYPAPEGADIDEIVSRIARGTYSEGTTAPSACRVVRVGQG